MKTSIVAIRAAKFIIASSATDAKAALGSQEPRCYSFA